LARQVQQERPAQGRRAQPVSLGLPDLLAADLPVQPESGARAPWGLPDPQAVDLLDLLVQERRARLVAQVEQVPLDRPVLGRLVRLDLSVPPALLAVDLLDPLGLRVPQGLWARQGRSEVDLRVPLALEAQLAQQEQ